MATLTLNINQKAQMAAKAAYDKELSECLACGISKEGAEWCASVAGNLAYDAEAVKETA
jgi:hypothetical protein